MLCHVSADFPLNRRVAAALFVVVAATACALPARPQEFPSVGLEITTLDGGDGELHAWYPSESAEKEFRLEPFDITVAAGGKPAAGKYPVILFSHGLAGRPRSHWQTAMDLARAGNVVLAPRHESDWHPSLAARVENRADELRAALSRSESHPALSQVADATRVGAVGYSLGGMSALFLAGGVPDIQIVRTHCAGENRDRDPQFCRRKWWQRAYAVVSALLRGDKPFFKLPEPAPLKAIALVAPAGVLFGPDSFEKLDAEVSIHRLGDDQVLRHPFHAEHLRDLLNAENDYHVHEKVGHFAFVSRHPEEAIAELGEKGRIVFDDPPGFNRAEFISKVNRELADFFRKNLAAD